VEKMRAARLQELEEMGTKLQATVRALPPRAGPPQPASGDCEISCADNWSATPQFAASTPRAEGEGEMTMRALVILTAVCFSTIAYAQDAAPKVGNKPLAQVKPKEPIGCKLVGTIKGTKLWAGDCTGPAELRGSATATETQSLSERATGIIPPGQKQ
jgi:hypothetical protein